MAELTQTRQVEAYISPGTLEISPVQHGLQKGSIYRHLHGGYIFLSKFNVCFQKTEYGIHWETYFTILPK